MSAEQEEFLRRSQESFRLGENEDALKWATRAIAADQTNYVGFAYRAQLNDTLRRFDAAVADYTKAHTFNPRNIHLVRRAAPAPETALAIGPPPPPRQDAWRATSTTTSSRSAGPR